MIGRKNISRTMDRLLLRKVETISTMNDVNEALSTNMTKNRLRMFEVIVEKKTN
jgi:hypothetical protein